AAPRTVVGACWAGEVCWVLIAALDGGGAALDGPMRTRGRCTAGARGPGRNGYPHSMAGGAGRGQVAPGPGARSHAPAAAPPGSRGGGLPLAVLLIRRGLLTRAGAPRGCGMPIGRGPVGGRLLRLFGVDRLEGGAARRTVGVVVQDLLALGDDHGHQGLAGDVQRG